MKSSEIFELWRFNKSRINAFIRKKVKREQDIDDIAQEVFIKFWIKNEEIKEKDKILNWLYSVTHFTIADFYRKKGNTVVHIGPVDNSIT